MNGKSILAFAVVALVVGLVLTFLKFPVQVIGSDGFGGSGYQLCLISFSIWGFSDWIVAELFVFLLNTVVVVAFIAVIIAIDRHFSTVSF